jgi:putative oxidoreductase
MKLHWTDIMRTPFKAASLGRIIARAGIGLFFILAGLSKIVAYAETGARMDSVGLRPVVLLLPLTIALEIGAGTVVIAGRKGAVEAALALALFTLATNAFFHRFWEFEGQMYQLELSLFFKNLTIAWALVLVASTIPDQHGDKLDLRG